MARPSSPASLRVGLFAEDQTDCETLKVLIRRMAPQRSVSFQSYGQDGCATLRRKAGSWIQDAVRKGCQALVIAHDLDRDPRNGQLNDEAALRKRLAAIPIPSSAQHLICIPVEELEAWFWADPAVLALVQGPGGPKQSPPLAHASPESLRRPKEALKALSQGTQKKPRYTTAQNPRLAENLNIALCAQRCPSFRTLREFVARF